MSKHILRSLFVVIALGFAGEAAAQTACQLPITPGPCRGSFMKWGYDSATNHCKQFVYGGCQGNANQFATEAECKTACVPARPVVKCAAARKVGPCRAAIRRYFWNTSSGTCDLFSWGGCQPNGNNFSTKTSCARACGANAN